MDIDRPPIKGSTSHPGFNVGQISVKIPQFLGSGGRTVCNILVATQPLVSVWELLMGVGENGEIANSSSPPAQSISFRAGKKAYLGEKVTLEKKGLGVTCILPARSRLHGVSAQCEKGWRVTKEQRCAPRLLSGCWSRLRRWSKKKKAAAGAAVSSGVKQHVGWGQEGGYVGGIYIRCKGPSQLLREHRQEWEVGILRDINWLGWTGFGKWPTFDVKQWIGIWILPWFWTIYGHEGVWRVSSGVGLGRWQNDGVCRAPPRPTANVHGDYQQWIIGGGVALTEGGLGSLLCIRRFVHELWIQIAGPYLCMSLNGQRLPNNLLI